jgi:hypothetical protein
MEHARVPDGLTRKKMEKRGREAPQQLELYYLVQRTNNT